MYLFSHLRKIYETYNPGSNEYNLSRYILCHIDKIHEMSLIDIARETDVSKSTASKFFQKITSCNGFSLFKSALFLDTEYIMLNTELIRNNANELKKLKYDGSGMDEYFDFNEVKKLSDDIGNANRVIFYGNENMRGCFDILINYLLLSGKDIKFSGLIFSDDQDREFLSLSEDDLLIVIEPYNTLIEFKSRLSSSIDMTTVLNEIKAKKVFVGLPFDGDRNSNTVKINKANNVFVDKMIIEYFSASLLNCYIDKKYI